jgi:hypothetical protein
MTMPTPIFDGRKLNTAGQISQWHHRDSSNSSGTAAYTQPLVVTANDHYVANVTDTPVGSRTCLEIQTLESKYGGGTSAVRSAIYSPPFYFPADGSKSFWVLQELFAPSDFPNLTSGGWQTIGSIGARGSTGPGTASIGMRLLNSRNELTWQAPELGGSNIWRGRPVTRGIWHVILRRWWIRSNQTADMEIWYGQRNPPVGHALYDSSKAVGEMLAPLVIQTLNVVSGATYANNNTRRTNFTFTFDTVLSTFPGVHVAAYHYHQGGMWSGTTRLRFSGPTVFDGARTINEVDPYYFEGTSTGLPGKPINVKAIVGQY